MKDGNKLIAILLVSRVSTATIRPTQTYDDPLSDPLWATALTHSPSPSNPMWATSLSAGNPTTSPTHGVFTKPNPLWAISLSAGHPTTSPTHGVFTIPDPLWAVSLSITKLSSSASNVLWAVPESTKAVRVDLKDPLWAAPKLQTDIYWALKQKGIKSFYNKQKQSEPTGLHFIPTTTLKYHNTIPSEYNQEASSTEYENSYEFSGPKYQEEKTTSGYIQSPSEDTFYSNTESDILLDDVDLSAQSEPENEEPIMITSQSIIDKKTNQPQRNFTNLELEVEFKNGTSLNHNQLKNVTSIMQSRFRFNLTSPTFLNNTISKLPNLTSSVDLNSDSLAEKSPDSVSLNQHSDSEDSSLSPESESPKVPLASNQGIEPKKSPQSSESESPEPVKSNNRGEDPTDSPVSSDDNSLYDPSVN